MARKKGLVKIPKKKFDPRTTYIPVIPDNYVKTGGFEEENKFFKDQAEELFNKILTGKKKIAFDVAFFLLNGFENWKKLRVGNSLKKYIEGVLKRGKCPDKYKSFQMAYHVAYVFGDLNKEENQKVAFESYRKIAHATLFNNKLLSDEENQKKNKFFQDELRREMEGAKVIRDDFEEENLDYDTIVPKLIEKGYVTPSYCVDNGFEKLDDEFRLGFPQCTSEQFDVLKDVLKFEKEKTSLKSSELSERIREIQRKNKAPVAVEEGIVSKLAFSEVDSNGAEIVETLIRKYVLKEVSPTEVRLKQDNNEYISRPEEIADTKFNKIWFLLQPPKDAVIVYKNVKQFLDKFKEYFNPKYGYKYKVESIK